MQLSEEEEQNWNGKLHAVSYLKLGTLLFDDLNAGPSFDFRGWKASTAGKEKQPTTSLKIKPKQFFKNIRTAPFLNKRVHLYRVFENTNPYASDGNFEILLQFVARFDRLTSYFKVIYQSLNLKDTVFRNGPGAVFSNA